MGEHFKALVLTYKSAPVEIREQVSLNEEGVKTLLRFMRDFTQTSDALVISTCNRTEIYYFSAKNLSNEILKGLKIIKKIPDDFEQHFTSLDHADAIQHLFDVSIGLDAQIIGDLQISGQVKNAYQWSADENMAGPFIHRIMHTIFFVNKRVVQETSFRDGAASISYATKELVEDLTCLTADPKILILGVGEIGQDVARNLSGSRLNNVNILNRTVEKAEKLAREVGFKPGGLSELDNALSQADVIISSVSVPQPLITKSRLESLRLSVHKFFIDLSIPRSIEPLIEEIPGAILYNMDDIQEKTNEALEKRKASIPKVREIIREAIAEFNDWSKEMVVSPTIQKLKTALEQIRKDELARYLKNSNPEEVAKLEEMSRSLMQKILKYPVLHLKAACKRGDPESLSELLLELFNVERISDTK
ncbi:MAG TPA: glutamyl-tRNA reductase [Cyclobacteriaceae bacterium]|nr:glutamyl-tRNA reductase [Cyclobacteriaceae bacterium]